MADGKLISTKQIKIDKDNRNIIIVLAITSFIIVFTIVATKSLIVIYNYQNRVSSAIQTSLTQVTVDQSNINTLETSYKDFVSKPTNIIGGLSSGIGVNQGNNQKIIQDALPATYDGTEEVLSINNLFVGNGIKTDGVSVTGGSVTAPASGGSAASTVSPVTTASTASLVPVQVAGSFSGSENDLNAFITKIQNCVRPFQINSITVSGTSGNLKMDMQLTTYYLSNNITVSTNTETVK
jgi:hypothetical protein